MWRPPFTLIRKIVYPSLKDNLIKGRFFSTKSRTCSTSRLTLVSASIGVLVGAGYGGYTHYKVNSNKQLSPAEQEEYTFLKEPPNYKPHYKVIGENDPSDMHIILFQYRTCPFCCKVRAYLDSRGFSYEIVEVDAVLRQAIKWSGYKKVPIVLVKVDGGYQVCIYFINLTDEIVEVDAVLRQAIKWSGYKKVPIVLVKVDGGYQQLMDSTAIISTLETYMLDKSYPIRDIIKFYPANKLVDKSGKTTTEIANRYFVMSHTPQTDGKVHDEEMEERKWRQWADKVLVHTLSPNVYRTTSEALESFKWFAEAGGWRQAFPAWECALMVYGGATAMYFIAKRLKKRHYIKEDARQSLYDAAQEWSNAIKKKGTPFLGGQSPNLADITVYGVFSSIEGCSAFQDLRDNTDVGVWYDNIKQAIETKQGKVVAVNAIAA